MNKILIFIFLVNYLVCFQNIINAQINKCIDECFEDIIKDNQFILPLLDSFTTKYKLKRLNSITRFYQLRKMEVQEVSNNKFGVFLKESTRKNDLILQVNKNKITSSKKINLNLFFKNSIFGFVEKIEKQLQKNFISYDMHNEIKQELRLILNLYFHFSRFKQSFLSDDFIGLNDDIISPIFNLNHYEKSILKNDEVLHEQINHLRDKSFNEFNIFQTLVRQNISDEQFSYFFQKNGISIQDFIFLKCFVKSKSQKIGLNLYMIPILNYVNQIDYVKPNEQPFTFLRKKNKIVFISTMRETKQDKQYFANYGYTNIYIHAIWGGFVPSKYNSHCQSVTVLHQDLSEYFEVPSNTCLDSKTLKAYSMIEKLLYMSSQQISLCNKRIPQNLQIMEKLSLMYEKCTDIFLFYHKKQYSQLWAMPAQALKQITQLYHNQYNRLKQYDELNSTNRQNQKFTTIFYQLYHRLYKSSQLSLNILNSFLKNDYIS